MILNSIRANFGINSQATRTRAGVSGVATIGTPTTNVALSSTADVAYQVQLVFGSTGAAATLDFETGDMTADTWVAGSAQVETATAAGTITASGNATVIVTAAGMTGSPKTISVPVINGDTAATWAGKVRTALAADTAVAALFTGGGTTTSIQLTRKPVSSHVVGLDTINVYGGNDSTLNISLDNGTCTGITTASTSTGTNGVSSGGVLLFNHDLDFEGISIPSIATVHAFGFENDGPGAVTYSFDGTPAFGVAEGGALGATAKRLFVNPTSADFLNTCTFDCTGSTRLIVTIIGETA